MRWFCCLIVQFIVTPFCYCTFLTSESFLAFPFPPPPFINNTLPQGYSSFDACLYGWIIVNAELNQLATQSVDYTSKDISNLQTQLQTMLSALNEQGPSDPLKTQLITTFTNIQTAVSVAPIDITTLQALVPEAQTRLGSWGITFPDGNLGGIPNMPTNPTQLNAFFWFLQFYNYSFITVAEGLIDPATYFMSVQSTLVTAINHLATTTAFDSSILMCGQTGLDLVFNSMSAGTFSLDILVSAMPYFRQVFLLLAPPGSFQ